MQKTSLKIMNDLWDCIPAAYKELFKKQEELNFK